MNILKSLTDIYCQMIITLSVLAGFGIAANGLSVLSQVFIATVVAALIDYPIKLFKNRKVEFPRSAIITGLIISLVLAPHQPWYIPAIAAVIAIASKHLIQLKGRHIFNPANLGLTIVALFTGLNWWGATNIYGVAVLGLFIVYKLRAWPLVISFLGTYFLIFSIFSLLHGGALSYAVLGDGALLFFAFLILTEHKTYPLMQRGRVVFGIIVAIVAALFQITGIFAYTIIGLVIADMLVPLINKLTVRQS